MSSIVISTATTSRLYVGWNTSQRGLRLHSGLRDRLDADCEPAKCWDVYRVGGCPSEMLHYVTGAPRIAAVCLERRWGRCDVRNLAVIGPNPDETGALLFPHLRHTRPLHTHTLTNAHTYGTVLGFPSATVQNAPRINTWSRSGPERPVLPIRQRLWRNGSQMFPRPFVRKTVSGGFSILS